MLLLCLHYNLGGNHANGTRMLSCIVSSIIIYLCLFQIIVNYFIIVLLYRNKLFLILILINQLEKVQASLIKTALGLPKYSRNTPILRALHIKKISKILEERHLSLTKAALHNTAKSRPFYLHIMHKCQYYHMNKHSNLL